MISDSARYYGFSRSDMTHICSDDAVVSVKVAFLAASAADRSYSLYKMAHFIHSRCRTVTALAGRNSDDRGG